MPAPSVSLIESALADAYIKQGFTKKTYDENSLLVDSKELSDGMKKQVRAQAIAINQVFVTWMSTQTVTIPVTSSDGNPSVGIPPLGGLVP